MGRKRTGSRKHVFLCLAGLIYLSVTGCAAIQEAQLRAEARDHLEQGQRLLAQGDFERAQAALEQVLSLSPQRPPEDEALLGLGLVFAHFGNAKKDYKKAADYFNRLMTGYPKSPLGEQAKIWANLLQENQNLKKSLQDDQQDAARLKQAVEKVEKPKQVVAKAEEPDEARETLLRSQRLLGQGDFDGAVAAAQRVLSLSPPRPSQDEALLTLGLIYAHPGNPKKDFAKSLEFFRRLVKEYPKSHSAEQGKIWIGVLQENEKLNEVIQKSKQVDLEIEEKKREIVK
jgi:outer membrane protein assembly factor BamD (BamD/ComL family)